MVENPINIMLQEMVFPHWDTQNARQSLSLFILSSDFIFKELGKSLLNKEAEEGRSETSGSGAQV